jgi:hypothetical protein
MKEQVPVMSGEFEMGCEHFVHTRKPFSWSCLLFMFLLHQKQQENFPHISA